jgi:hypothetical protein
MKRCVERAGLLLVFCAVSLGAPGCRTMSDVIKDKENGTVQVYPVDSDQAWKIAIQVFRWQGTDEIEEHRDQNMLLTTSKMNLVSEGTFVGAWVEALDPEHTKVTVVTRRKFATNLTTTLDETTFHRRFQEAVALVKSGKPLPIEVPAD